MTKKKTHLNFNESPFGPTPAVIEAMHAACTEVNHYPQFDSGDLLRELSRYCDVPVEWLTVGNGSLMTVHQIMIASGQKEVVYSWPSFDDYPVMAEGLGMKTRPTKLSKDGACDLEDLYQNITADTSLVIICSPNTPTGGIVTNKDAEEFVKKVPSSVTIMIDEAYVDFARHEGIVHSVELVKKYPNVVISRTLSKGQGLAGLRIGYSIAQPALTKKIAAAGVPKFHISHVSLAGAVAALRQTKEMKQRIDAIVAERDRLVAMLQRLDVEVMAGHGNFVWLPVGEKAQQVADALAAEGVLVRALMPFGIRISVGTSDDTDQLEAALNKAVMQSI